MHSRRLSTRNAPSAQSWRAPDPPYPPSACVSQSLVMQAAIDSEKAGKEGQAHATTEQRARCESTTYANACCPAHGAVAPLSSMMPTQRQAWLGSSRAFDGRLVRAIGRLAPGGPCCLSLPPDRTHTGPDHC